MKKNLTHSLACSLLFLFSSAEANNTIDNYNFSAIKKFSWTTDNTSCGENSHSLDTISNLEYKTDDNDWKTLEGDFSILPPKFIARFNAGRNLTMNFKMKRYNFEGIPSWLIKDNTGGRDGFFRIENQKTQWWRAEQAEICTRSTNQCKTTPEIQARLTSSDIFSKEGEPENFILTDKKFNYFSAWSKGLYFRSSSYGTPNLQKNVYCTETAGHPYKKYLLPGGLDYKPAIMIDETVPKVSQLNSPQQNRGKGFANAPTNEYIDRKTDIVNSWPVVEMLWEMELGLTLKPTKLYQMNSSAEFVYGTSNTTEETITSTNLATVAKNFRKDHSFILNETDTMWWYTDRTIEMGNGSSAGGFSGPHSYTPDGYVVMKTSSYLNRLPAQPAHEGGHNLGMPHDYIKSNGAAPLEEDSGVVSYEGAGIIQGYRHMDRFRMNKYILGLIPELSVLPDM